MQIVLLRQVAFAFLVFAMLCAEAWYARLRVRQERSPCSRAAPRCCEAPRVTRSPRGSGCSPATSSRSPRTAWRRSNTATAARSRSGQDTRAHAVRVGRKKVHREYYVMQGALKLTGVKQGARFRFATPIFNVQPVEGALVLVVSGSEASLFAESGETRLAAGSPTLRLRGGDFYTRRNGQKGWVSALPSKAFVEALPNSASTPCPGARRSMTRARSTRDGWKR